MYEEKHDEMRMKEDDQELDEMCRQSQKNNKTNKSFVARKSENSRLV